MSLSACDHMMPAVPAGAPLDEVIDEDRQAVQKGVEPLGETLGLDQAIARALKYNLDRRAKLMEEALAARQVDEVGFDRIPKLLGSAGYSHRDEERTSRSKDSVTGAPSLANPSISQDKEHLFSSLTLSWNLLDYGLAHFSYQQAVDRALQAEARRRKASQLLVQDVRSAFFRAASAQKLQGEVRAALALAEDGLADARKSEQEALRNPLDSLRYQRQLTENMRLLESIEQELVAARFELAALINAPVMQQVRLLADDEPLPPDLLTTSVDEMELAALRQNPDLRDHLLQRRIAQAEAYKAVGRMLPNIGVSYGAYNDDDRYLINQQWNEATVNVSFNLLNLLYLDRVERNGRAGVRLAEQRRLAAHVAVVTQVHVARAQVAHARTQFERADSLWSLDSRILEMTAKREQAQAGSKLDRVAAQTTAIISQLRRYQALAQWHAAAGRLQATLGTDPVPDSTDDQSLEALSRGVRQRLLSPLPQAAAPAAPAASVGG
ncbi:TolC family protein [Ideonella sp. TBM-1]|uniref:TolC family protein n=2 Tax=Ideonella livida TaxID=2707176 RepID=A0A7C9TNJ1_9BURK|nr:TolC family protein [Ideonella livida]